MTQPTDIPLLGAAYNALVENCVFQQDSYAQREGLRIIKSLSTRLEITPEKEVAEALENLDD